MEKVAGVGTGGGGRVGTEGVTGSMLGRALDEARLAPLTRCSERAVWLTPIADAMVVRVIAWSLQTKQGHERGPRIRHGLDVWVRDG